jgi:hypothetical protein
MARNKKTPSNSRVRAIELLLNYGHGRPAQALAIGVGSFDAQTPGDEMATNGLTALLMSARAESGKDPITGGKPLLLPPPIEGEGADEYRERLDAVVKAAPAVTSSVPKPAPLKSIELSIEEPEAAPANPAPIIEEPVETKVAAPEPAMVEKAPPPPPPLPKAPPRGAPAAFAAHYEEKAADRAAQRQADLPGGQVPAQDFFRPDSTAESPQGPLEVVTLTRSEYGGVRRV